MVRSLVLAVLTAMLMGVSPVFAYAPMTVRNQSETAEVCSSKDGVYTVVFGFGETLGHVIFRADPALKPVVLSGFTLRKESGGVMTRNEVSFDMFEVIAETFGTVSKARSQWRRTFESSFVGQVTVIDDKAREAGTIPMKCNAAIIEYL